MATDAEVKRVYESLPTKKKAELVNEIIEEMAWKNEKGENTEPLLIEVEKVKKSVSPEEVDAYNAAIAVHTEETRKRRAFLSKIVDVYHNLQANELEKKLLLAEASKFISWVFMTRGEKRDLSRAALACFLNEHTAEAMFKEFPSLQ